jgi:hypothetical protein
VPAVDGPFAGVLESQRARFNADFVAARRTYPSLDATAFSAVLAGVVAPIVAAVDEVEPARTRAAAESLFDLALELVGQGLLGPTAREPVITDAWRSLLPGSARLLAADPPRFIGSITNALYNLATTPAARPRQWLEDMAAVVQNSDGSLETMLQAGQVAAWRAGLAQYRSAALAICSTLPPRLAFELLKLPAQSAAADLRDRVIARLIADPWLSPADALSQATPRRLRVVGHIGTFRGFGGLFIRPPSATRIGGQFVVADGESSWVLLADLYGATFHRLVVDRSEESQRPETHNASRFHLGRSGHISKDGLEAEIPELQDVSSWAADEHTLVATTTHSHSLVLVAAAPDATKL